MVLGHWDPQLQLGECLVRRANKADTLNKVLWTVIKKVRLNQHYPISKWLGGHRPLGPHILPPSPSPPTSSHVSAQPPHTILHPHTAALHAPVLPCCTTYLSISSLRHHMLPCCVAHLTLSSLALGSLTALWGVALQPQATLTLQVVPHCTTQPPGARVGKGSQKDRRPWQKLLLQSDQCGGAATEQEPKGCNLPPHGPHDAYRPQVLDYMISSNNMKKKKNLNQKIG